MSLLHYFFGWPGGSVWPNVIAVGPCAIVTYAWMSYRRSCALPWCFRRGEHPVAKTTWKVCSEHHHMKHHLKIAARFKKKHPGRLGWGDSHRAPRR